MAILTEWTQTCGACPEQYEGRLDSGEFVYLRHRHGSGYLGIGVTLDGAVCGEQILVSWGDAELDGTLRPGALPKIIELAAIDDPKDLIGARRDFRDFQEDGLTFYGIDGKVI